MRNPTLKDELDVKSLWRQIQLRFRSTPLAMRDILAFRPALVPVGEDQLAHIEMCREVARRFNHTYCAGSDGADSKHLEAGGIFPIPRDWLAGVAFGRGRRDQKMSKSLGNAFSSPTARRKSRRRWRRLHGRMDMNAPGDTNNALFQYVRAFFTDPARGRARGSLPAGDAIATAHQSQLTAAIDALLAPCGAPRALEGPEGTLASRDHVAHASRANVTRARRSGECGRRMKLTFTP